TALSGLTTDNPLDGSTSCYIQAGAGIKTRLDFPHLSDFNSLVGRTVNKAELVIPFEPGDRFYPQDKLFLLYKNQQGSLQILPDQTMQTIGGGVNLFHNEYRFNISRYIQKVLNDEISPEAIYLLSSSAGVSVNRVFAHGPLFSSEDKRENMRLIITLTN
ncbi:MAG: hypothetical protein IT223_01385, partial [Crocinitomicaceae bacterium]|nr:hypothetical protein [Crocinitomicaceae bacterium]